MLTEQHISEVLRKFYERVRLDDQLGPAFSVVEDWDEHLQRLGEFWSSVMLMSGRYKGNPVSMHAIHAHRIRPEMFGRWLELWRLTTSELLPSPDAMQMQAKAQRIAARLSAAILGHRAIAAASANHADAEARPYRVTAEFDESSIPPPLLADHSLKAGTWGVIRVSRGSVRYRAQADPAVDAVLDSATPALILPETKHHLELLGPVTLRVEFYDRNPARPYETKKGLRHA